MIKFYNRSGLRQSYQSQKGFTLVELIIYVATVSVVLVIGINLGLNLIKSDSQARSEQEIYNNARLLVNTITQKIRESDDVATGSSVFGEHPGVLALTDIVFDTQIDGTVRKMRIQEGGVISDLTSDGVNVSNFVLTDLTRGSEPKNVLIQLTLEGYGQSFSIETAVSIRKTP